MPLEVLDLNDGGRLHFDKKGAVQSHRLGSGVLLHTRSGVIHGEFTQLVQSECEQQLRSFGHCVLMVDAALTKMHTTDFREAMTRWFQLHEHAEVHVLTSSAMVRMAVTVATMSGDDVRAKTYEQEESWLAVGRQHLPGFRRRKLMLPSESR